MTQTQSLSAVADPADRHDPRSETVLFGASQKSDAHEPYLRTSPNTLSATDWRFLAESGISLGQAEELDDAVDIGLRILVPRVADFAILWLTLADEPSTMLRFAYARPELAALFARQAGADRVMLREEHPARRVQRTGRIEWGTVDAARLISVASDTEHLSRLRSVAPKSAIHLPLRERGRTVGSLLLGRACADAPLYCEADVALANELAVRLAMVLARAEKHDALRSAYRARAVSVASTSHDLKDPLALIETAIAFAVDGMENGELPGEASVSPNVIIRQLRVARRAAQRARALVAHTLDSLASGKKTALLSPRAPGRLCRPGTVLRELTDEMSLLARARGITLALEAADDLPSVGLAAVDFSRAIGNVLGNALKYTPSGGRVTVRASEVDGSVQVSISDTGRGIRASDLPNVFRPFWRAATKAAAGGADSPDGDGSGLGLAIARDLVQRAGGSIWCRSTLGAGATFRVQLPCVAAGRNTT
jgi:signal transduction histidine kinase